MGSVVLVFPEATGLRGSTLDYLGCLQAWSSPGDRCVVYTLDAEASEVVLQNLARPGMEVRRAAVASIPEESAQRIPLYTARISPEREITTNSLERIQRFRPQGPWETTSIALFSPHRVVNQFLESDELALVVVDLRNDDVTPYLNIDWTNARLRSATFVTEDVPVETIERFDRLLLRAGLRRAGRLWGSAGATRLYVRPESSMERVRVWLAQTRVDIGAWIVRQRERRSLKRMNISLLDSATYAALPQPTGGEVDRFVAVGHMRGGVETVDVPVTPVDVLAVASEAYRKFGVFPISFSHPKPRELVEHLDGSLSPVVPGYPYSFFDEEEYLGFYARYALGVTHRKAGWDCFRHVEILAAGAVPLMIDAAQIPPFSLIHHPREAMVEVAERFKRDGTVPGWHTRLDFRSHFSSFLTTEAMAKYLVDLADVNTNQRVLFIDRHLPATVDYQSTLSLIGLKQLLGATCEVAFPVEYLYQHSTTPTSHLYGRGFGYSRVLDPALATASEQMVSAEFDWSSVDTFDVVVVGSVSRNRDIADFLVHEFPEKKKVFIHGEDTPPDRPDVDRLRGPGVVGFVRSIHAG